MTQPDKIWKDKDFLHEQYVELEKSTNEISDGLDCTPPTILYWLNKYGIETRDANPQTKYPELKDKSFLLTHYVERDKSANEIANELGCDVKVVTKRLKEANIEVTNGHYKELRNSDYLENLYVSKGLSTFDIADVLGCSQNAVVSWLHKHGIETRDPGHDGLWGEENPRWKDELDPEVSYGSGWHKQRQKALKRDGYECRACGMGRDKHIEKFGSDLDVHHIVPIREFESTQAANDLGNLVTACKKCHRKFEGMPVFPKL